MSLSAILRARPTPSLKGNILSFLRSISSKKMGSEKSLVISKPMDLAKTEKDDTEVNVVTFNRLIREKLAEEYPVSNQSLGKRSGMPMNRCLYEGEQPKLNLSKEAIQYTNLSKNLLNVMRTADKDLFHTMAHLSNKDCKDKEKDNCVIKQEKNPGRVKYSPEVEDAINKQIMTELNAAFGYLTVASFFGRTDVGKLGTHGFFMGMFHEEIEHALMLIKYQLQRGGTVKLSNICIAENVEWCSIAKALEIALEMEKLVTEEICNIIRCARKVDDFHTENMLTSEFISEQFDSISQLAKLLSRAITIGRCGISDHLIDNELAKSQGHNAKSSYNK